MADKTPVMTGGCQCGAIRYALYATPESTVCHCRMCQKATGGLFAALSKVPMSDFAWTSKPPLSFQSSSVAERHFCEKCGTPLTFHYLDGTHIEVTTGSLDRPHDVPVSTQFGIESRAPWLDLLMPGRLPEKTTAEILTRNVVSRQHSGAPLG